MADPFLELDQLDLQPPKLLLVVLLLELLRLRTALYGFRLSLLLIFQSVRRLLRDRPKWEV
jgi:hypothetical protein